MKKGIVGIFNLQILLFALSVTLILIISTLQIFGQYQRKRITADFHYELKLVANDFYYKVLFARENVKALSSRSTIRGTMISLDRGEIGLEEARAFIQPKYAEGARVYKDLDYTRRLDNGDRIVAEYPPGEGRDLAFSPQRLTFFRDDRGCHVIINNPITDSDRTVGTDQASFFLCDPEERNFNLLGNVLVVGEDISSDKYPNLVSSVPLGETGFYLKAELDYGRARKTRMNTLSLAFIQAGLITLAIALITYLTIMRIMFRIMGEDDRLRDRAAKQDREAVIGQITGGLSHEINNVLTGIFGLVDLLEGVRNFPEEGKTYLANLRQSSDRMTLFVRKLTDYSKYTICEYTPLDLSDLLEKTVREEGRKTGPSVTIRLERETGALPLRMGADHLKRVLSNLFENAREAMEGSGEILLTCGIESFNPPRPCSRCEGLLSGEWIALRLTDTGRGIPPEIADRIFDPFFTTKGYGDGLGLSQAAGIVTRYEGHLFLESSRPGRTVMAVYLPRAGNE